MRMMIWEIKQTFSLVIVLSFVCNIHNNASEVKTSKSKMSEEITTDKYM